MNSNKSVVERNHTNIGNVGDASGATQASLYNKEFTLERSFRNIKDMVNPIIRFQNRIHIGEKIYKCNDVTDPLPFAQVVENSCWGTTLLL